MRGVGRDILDETGAETEVDGGQVETLRLPWILKTVRWLMVAYVALVGCGASRPPSKANSALEVPTVQPRTAVHQVPLCTLEGLAPIPELKAIESAWREGWQRNATTAVVDEHGPVLVELVSDTHRLATERFRALDLLVTFRWTASTPLLRAIVESKHCPAHWAARAAVGLVSIGVDEDLARVEQAFVVAVAKDIPTERAASLCYALSLRDSSSSSKIEAALERLFLFAPHLVTASCMSLITQHPRALILVRRVLDDPDWPYAVERDPRDALARSLGQGAALLLLGHLRATDALERLAQAVQNASLEGAAVRDGAVQGLSALGTEAARRVLRQMMADPSRRSPRVAHALLRLLDRSAVPALENAALDPSALVEVRLAAANALTLLSTNLSPQTWRTAILSSPLGPPFETLDERLISFALRLEVAQECGLRPKCWSQALVSVDPQRRARAFWQYPFVRVSNESLRHEFENVAWLTLVQTLPNTHHDAVVGAISVLGQSKRAFDTQEQRLLSKLALSWERQTSPMGLPFSIPAALRKLAQSP